jgi:sugar phosphate isomerase/epimerase
MSRIGFTSIAMKGAPWTDAFNAAVAHGFGAFELCCGYPDIDPERVPDRMIAEVREIAEARGIELCVHAPFFELNIAAHCPGIREVSVKSISKASDLAKKLGAKVMVVHNGGYAPAGPPGSSRLNDNRMRKHWDNNIESLRTITDYAGERGVTICLENIGFNPFSIDRSFEDLREIRDKVGPSLRFTLDMGHARLQEGVRKGMDVLRDKIRHIHLTDNFGETDDHLPLGEGNGDYSEHASFLADFPHVITLEVMHGGTTPDAILRARQSLESLLAHVSAPKKAETQGNE